MAWAIFMREFNYSNPKSRHSYNVQPSSKPQEWDDEVVAAAVAAGAAHRIKGPPHPRRKSGTEADTTRRKA